MYSSNYHPSSPLLREALNNCPFEELKQWIKDHKASRDPNAAILATVNIHGEPSTRVVLIKDIQKDKGLLFFTNTLSPKAQDLMQNPNVSLSFYWPKDPRQCQVKGEAHPCSPELSQCYFHKRPIESQVVSYCSNQSQPLESKRAFQILVNKKLKHYSTTKQLPPLENWGGYWIKVNSFEFWKGGPNRLHDRFLYFSKTNGSWGIKRLQP